VSRNGRVALGLLLAAAGIVAGIVAPAQSATAAIGTEAVACEVTYQAFPYTGGFTAEVAVKNSGTVVIDGWTLSFPMDDGVEIVEIWNAKLNSPSGQISTSNEPWNGRVEPGQSINLGFRATGTAAADPSTFTVNGVTCAIVG
jgi:hypothetical protein